MRSIINLNIMDLMNGKMGLLKNYENLMGYGLFIIVRVIGIGIRITPELKHIYEI